MEATIQPKKMRVANRISTREFVDNEKAVNESERTIVHTISSSIIDRYGEIVDPKGMVQENYSKNPIVLFGHNNGVAWLTGAPPLIPIAGKSLWRKLDGEKILSKTKFGESTDFMEDVWNLAKDGFLPATSIGFIPMAFEAKKLGDITDLNPSNRGEYDKATDVYIWRKWELLEYSLVPIPANPEALQNALAMAGSREMRMILESLQAKQSLCELESCRGEMQAKIEALGGVKKQMEDVGSSGGTMIADMEDMAKRVKKCEEEMDGMKELSILLPEISQFFKELQQKTRQQAEIAVGRKEVDQAVLISRSVDRAISRMRGKVVDD